MAGQVIVLDPYQLVDLRIRDQLNQGADHAVVGEREAVLIAEQSGDDPEVDDVHRCRVVIDFVQDAITYTDGLALPGFMRGAHLSGCAVGRELSGG
jgi:hypothetical protein